MTQNTIGIRREDLSKRGEKRVAVTPDFAQKITQMGHSLLVQPRIHPTEGTLKRAFPDEQYATAGAEITEDLGAARVIFGLKEIELPHILADKTYLCFSHTHKGQVKNRKMLKTFMDQRATLIDYELVTHPNNARIITAFTYYAGYAGMIDTLWTVGKRYEMAGIDHPFAKVPQSIETEDLGKIKDILRGLAGEIKENGTPDSLPPFINLILGTGKTSTGAQEIYDLLEGEAVGPHYLEQIYREGSRDRVYKCVLDIPDMFRLKSDASVEFTDYQGWTRDQQTQHYFQHPEDFESNLDKYLPYASILMNCILWSPEFPRTMSKDFTAAQWAEHQTLQAIGDITCDPNGSIEFSKETWIDNPVYIYDPNARTLTDGFDGEGIAVMAVTNLPCEFSADASQQFSTDMTDILPGILTANYDAASVGESGLPEAVAKAAILWNGELTEPYAYMQEFVEGVE